MDMYEEIYKLKKSSKEGVLVTVVQRKGHGPANVGKKMLVCSDGSKKGTVGGGELEYFAIEKAKEVFKEKKHSMVSYDFTGENLTNADVCVDMICGGLVTLYYEYIGISPRIYILGAGHVGKCLADILINLDYVTTVIDDREDVAREISMEHEVLVGDYSGIVKEIQIPDGSYVVVTGYTHEIDYEMLKAIYSSNCKPKYIGLLASERKARIIIEKLKNEVRKDIDLSVLYAPVGIDIGGDSPEGIALSVISEIQAIRYNIEGNKHLTKKWS